MSSLAVADIEWGNVLVVSRRRNLAEGIIVAICRRVLEPGEEIADLRLVLVNGLTLRRRVTTEDKQHGFRLTGSRLWTIVDVLKCAFSEGARSPLDRCLHGVPFLTRVGVIGHVVIARASKCVRIAVYTTNHSGERTTCSGSGKTHDSVTAGDPASVSSLSS